ncbi:G kinase-anchoring protein 1-A-like [Anopheles stephensi]|uniref:G kinase-anchoring protein 1-A-like n=1 Tax=Anopheles stephensi TaxID=30069 RepID=UPI0007D3715B|nr:G kinase-anchoring protein 1-A-like [Anopheles stephensi]
MFTVVPSRFAGLKIEDDDDGFRKPRQKSKSNATTKPKAAPGKSSTAQQTAPQQQPKKPKPKPQKAKPSNDTMQEEQWSKWQQKDTELVEKSYVSDLEQALLLSKLDFEANKTKYNQLEREAKQSAAKDKKPKTLSLQEFQDKVSKELNEKQLQRKREQQEAEYNRNYTFFEQIDLETKQILNKEQMKALLKQNNSKSANSKESPKEDNSPTAEPCLSELDLLKVENLNLKEEIAVLRDRYRKVVAMLKNGEMKEKTELMIEIEKLRKVQEDMTTEMTTLYGQLEQAKSRTNQEAKGKEKPTNR